MKNYKEFMYKAYAMYWHASYNNLRSKLKHVDQTSRYPDDVQEGFCDIMEELEKFDKLKAEDNYFADIGMLEKDSGEKDSGDLEADIEMLEKYSRDLEERLEKKYEEKVEKDNKTK